MNISIVAMLTNEAFISVFAELDQMEYTGTIWSSLHLLLLWISYSYVQCHVPYKGSPPHTSVNMMVQWPFPSWRTAADKSSYLYERIILLCGSTDGEAENESENIERYTATRSNLSKRPQLINLCVWTVSSWKLNSFFTAEFLYQGYDLPGLCENH